MGYNAINTSSRRGFFSFSRLIFTLSLVGISIALVLASCVEPFSISCHDAEGNVIFVRSDGSECVDLDTTPPAAVTDFTAVGGNRQVALSWTNPSDTDLAAVILSWRNHSDSSAEPETHTFTPVTAGAAMTHTVTGLADSTRYLFTMVTQDASKNTSTPPISVTAITDTPVDSDGDTLIEVYNIDILNNIRHNLAGTSYKTSSSDAGTQCGTAGTTACTGYELMRDLDFAAATSYESGGINSDWQPTGGIPASAANDGWTPIGTAADPFLTTFEGNGKSISSLYVRNSTSSAQRIGLFGQVGSTSTAAAIQNLIVRDGAVYGGTGSDYAGGIAGALVNGTIIDSFVIGGTINGGAGATDRVGGLVGENNGTVAASYATATVDGAGGDTDYVGGLVGENTGTISASYATGTVTGGADASDRVGSLVGNNSGTITASYAVGAANGGAGDNDRVGGLVGSNNGSGIISQSYSVATTDGGDDADDFVGALVGENGNTINDSYGFGMVTGNERGSTGPSDGTAQPSAVTNAAQLTSTTTAATPWNTVAGGAWDLGTNAEIPLLKYADYDGGSGIDYCAPTPAIFPSIVPSTTADTLTCGTTLIPGQSALRARFAPPTPPAPVTSLTATIASGTSIQLDWSNPSDADLATILISWATVAIPGAEVGNFTRVSVTPSGAATYTVIGLTTDTPYRFSVTAVDTDGNRSTPETVDETPRISIDSNNNNLIDISNLEMLNNIRHNLEGTSYKTSGSDVGTQCGTGSTTACTGYELMRDLDFAIVGSYESGSINDDWRPTGGIPASAANDGWTPIGTAADPFLTTFEGNGKRINRLYARATTSGAQRIGLFGQVGNASEPGAIQNLTVLLGAIYGGAGSDYAGGIAGALVNGTIIDSFVINSTVNGGAGATDRVGGLVGENNGTVAASYATATVDGAGGDTDYAGGLVGENTGTISASYATGNITGGADASDRAGGLVGINSGTITASYAVGTANGGTGATDRVGGLVGSNTGTGIISQSYSTAGTDGGDDTDDFVGALVGENSSGTINDSYGFGVVVGNEQGSSGPDDGTAKPSAVTNAIELTSTTTAATLWNTVAGGAWDLGTNTEIPLLKYADYDGGSGIDYCAPTPAIFPSIVPSTTVDTLTCGTTLIPGQSALRARAVPPAPVTSLTATIASETSIQLDWSNPSDADLSIIRISWATVADPDTEISNDVLFGATPSGAATYTVAGLTTNTPYRFSVVAIDMNGNLSTPETVDETPRASIDSNNNNLIDINNLEMLNNIRHNLAGTSYKISSSDAGAQCGTNGATACTGYELMRDLDFAATTSYESGGINSDWRPTGGIPASAANDGWTPIGTAADPFLTTFEGNGKSISSLYVRNSTSSAQRIGLFGQVGSTSTAAAIQNLIARDGAVYGGTGSDYAGGIAGALVNGTIIDSFVIGGTINGGAGATDRIGGLVGENNGTIAASYATATVDGAGGDTDYAGGLVGENTGTISASYATGNITGGADASDRAGGLVGINSGTIIASYAVGAANGGAGDTDRVGGLVGSNIGSGTISQSYSAGNTDGGDDADDFVGALVGQTISSLTESYGFGTVTDNEQASGPNDGGVATLTGVSHPAHLTSTTVSSWNTVTVAGGAWDLGTNAEIPLLKYADYDGGSGIDYCAPIPAVFPSIVPGTVADPLTCGTTLIPGQSDLRARFVPPTLPDPVTSLTATIASGTSIQLNWSNPSDADLATILISWATVAIPGAEVGNFTRVSVTPSGAATYTATGLTANTPYRFSVTAVDIDGNRSTPETVDETPRIFIDVDGNNLIDINNLEMLNNIRFNLEGTSYKTSSGDSGARCGTAGTVTCIGYELMRDLDFAAVTSYESGSINSDWRPTGGIPASAANAGWTPIGTATTPFLTTFEGNGKSISSLYVRVITSGAQRIGLFGQVGSTSTAAAIQNLIVRDSAVYGGTGSDYAGGIAGALANGTIIDSFVIGGTINGGAGALDRVGGLVGENNGTVAASYATATVDGAGGDTDYAGGLVGENTATISASYATGTVTGGPAASDRAGGLVGINSGTIIASYAVGAANGGAGVTDRVGGLVGDNTVGGIISQSYSAGNTDGGDDASDYVGALVGENSNTINDSYGFGMVTDNEQGSSGPSDGTAKPSAVTNAAQLTTTTTASTTWNTVAGGAWDLGTNAEIPLLKYADYDGGSGIDYCAATPAVFPSIVPGTIADPLTCGTTLIPGQSDLRARFAPPAQATSLITTVASLTSVKLDWSNPSDADLATILISWATVAAPDTEIGNITVLASAPATYTAVGLTTNTSYRFSVTAVDTDDYRSTPETVEDEPRFVVDPDGNNLINIGNLEMLNNIRSNLAGNSYKTSSSDPGVQCGIRTDTPCAGYELTTALDFAAAGSYESGSVNATWRPTGGIPASAPNAGWTPIGTQSDPFTAIFDGKGETITRLYARNSVNTSSAQVGLFGAIGASGTVRNLGIVSSAVYGGSARDWVGVIAGRMAGAGTISNAYTTDSTTDGSAGDVDIVGGLVGESSGTITSSRAESVVVDGGEGDDDIVGGLVGRNTTGTITASYVTTTGNGIRGRNGDRNIVGGLVGENLGTVADSYAIGDVSISQGIAGVLVGRNGGTIAASYASGTARSERVGSVGGLIGVNANDSIIVGSYAASFVLSGSEGQDCTGGFVGSNHGTVSASYAVGGVNGGAGTVDFVGGLVGCWYDGDIIASYVTGNSDGGMGVSDYVGSLVGFEFPAADIVTASYAFGTIDGEVTSGQPHSGSTKPGAVNNPADLISSNVGSSWDSAAQRTAGAWQYGSTYGGPALQYADYDGPGGINYCALFPTGACASNTLLPNQPVIDQGGSNNTAYEVDIGFSLGGNISIPSSLFVSGDADVVKITVVQSGTLVIGTRNSGMNTQGTLSNAAGTQLVYNDNGDAGVNFKISYAASPGVYYVRAYAYSNQTGGYVLDISLE